MLHSITNVRLVWKIYSTTLINFPVPSVTTKEKFHNTDTSGQSYKTFYGCNLCNKLVFVPGKPFQPSLMFGGKSGTYLSEASWRCSTLMCVEHSLPTNIILGWKGFPGTNTTRYKNLKIMAVKRFIGLAPWPVLKKYGSYNAVVT